MARIKRAVNAHKSRRKVMKLATLESMQDKKDLI